MRKLVLATIAGLGVAVAGPAMAQQARPAAGGQWHGGGQQWHGGGGQWHGNSGGQWHGGNGSQWHGSRGSGSQHWGGSIGGRWIGGARAPGGWSAYRRPVRGWAMPSYWLTPNFYVTDWGAYGLTAPPYGYHWSRYYDDAVLIDQYGRAMDCVSDLDWQGDGPDGYDDHGDYDYDYSHDAGPGAPYPPPPPGARVETRTYGYEGGPPPPPPVVVRGGADCGCGGWYYPGATTTTVTITSVPVTTTTTRTEYVEEAVRPVVHHVRRAYHPRTPTKIIRRYHTKLIKR